MAPALTTGLALGLIALVIAIVWPDLSERGWRRFERAMALVARRRTTCWAGMGLLVLFVRGALLPLWPIPKPVIYDEFGYLLQADTFASGRLTNRPHALWPFFESIYILQQPTYNAKYPPGQGLALAAGQRLFGHAWFGVWLTCGALMAALCWALQGWLPPAWALFGAFLALRLCLFSYWMNSYWGGALAGIGGALVLGAYPRIVRKKRSGYAWLAGIGLVILANTRMYEGLLYAIPILIALGFRQTRARVWTPIGTCLALGAAFVLFYNYRVTGRAVQVPQSEYQLQYGYAPMFNFLPLDPLKTYRHESFFNLSHSWEFDHWAQSRSWGVVIERAKQWFVTLSVIAGGAPIALVILAALRWAIRDKRARLPLLAAGILVLGSFLQVAYYPHYAAPAAAAVLILAVQSFRHLREWRIGGKPVGCFLSRVAPAAAFLVVLGTEGARIYRQETPEQIQPVNARRDKLEQIVRDRTGGRHVIIVRYTGKQVPHEEWIYNRADIDGATVVWAHDMGLEQNRNLIRYYQDRSIWILQPDIDPERLEPYAGQ
jgi:hypothetical protein